MEGKMENIIVLGFVILWAIICAIVYFVVSIIEKGGE